MQSIVIFDLLFIFSNFLEDFFKLVKINFDKEDFALTKISSIINMISTTADFY